MTAEEIYMQEQEKHPMQFGAYTLPEQWQLDAMEAYARQLTPYTHTAQLNAVVDKAMGVIREYMVDKLSIPTPNPINMGGYIIQKLIKFEHDGGLYVMTNLRQRIILDSQSPEQYGLICAIADYITELNKEKK